MKETYCTCGAKVITSVHDDLGFWDVCVKCGKRVENGYHYYNHYDGEDHIEYYTLDGDVETYDDDD